MKTVVLFVVLFCFHHMDGICQNDRITNFAEKGGTAPNDQKESIRIELDNQTYSPGEEVYIKISVGNYQTREPFLPTRNILVELYDGQKKVVQKKFLYIGKDLTVRRFVLKNDLPLGEYKLRVYTNAFRDDENNTHAEQSFTIEKKEKAPPAGTDHLRSS